jgi:2-amino-4-hydroxy-6-hydroxymethyldihydropteridine diphosphokinase
MLAFIAIGSNLGDRAANVRKAAQLTCDGAKASLVSMSSLYETDPWGITEQGAFVNAVMSVETSLAPSALLAHLKSIESVMGRKKVLRWGPRVIDLDIIFYGDLVMDKNGLTIPHPRAHERAFVMVPLAEIAPDLKHPVVGRSAADIAKSLDSSGVRKMES